jgi:hypothetical protein
MHNTQPSKARHLLPYILLTYPPQTSRTGAGIILTNSRCADSEISEVEGQKECAINLEFKSICLTGSEKFCTITERKNEGEKLFRDVLPLQ